jgi:AmmeMemoRadiSam system protein A
MLSLSEADRFSLLRFARQVVIDSVTHARLPEIIPTGGVFANRCGVFVTLHSLADRLRGCIGIIEPVDPLGDAIAHCAAGAALHDPRFSPMQPRDLRDFRIEISLLSVPAPIDPTQIEIGRHGLLISRGTRHGLLLPQVATEHHLTTEAFLAETCRKALLPREAWRESGTTVMAFTCEVFSEKEAFKSGAARPR